MKKNYLKDIVMIGQLGLSVIMPLLMCFLGAYVLNRRYGTGVWIYIPALILGLGASWMTAYKFYLEQNKRNASDDAEYRHSYNEHI